MLVRTPTFYDIYKAVKYLVKDEVQQNNLLVDWIKNFKQNPKFYSLIALEKKEVVGVLTGIIKISPDKKIIFNLSTLAGNTNIIKEKLCNKVVSEIDPDVSVYTGSDQWFLESVGFQVVSYNMMWLKTNNTNEVVNESH